MNALDDALPRRQSRGEEIANSVSHGITLLAALAAFPVLMVFAVRDGGGAWIVGASVFGVALILLYLSSTLYHGLPHGRAKRVFHVLDHSAIYVLIAGTYTPFTLGVLAGGGWGWTLFALVWGLAALGIALKAFGDARHQAFSLGLYLSMGWLVLIAMKPLLRVLPDAGLWWLVAGGVAYTAGVVFFVLDERVRYAHFIWHLFVLTGSACHFVSVLRYSG